MSEQSIYFDPDDEAADGNGWNIVEDGGAVALRYPTRELCVAWCEAEGFPFTFTESCPA